MTNAMKCVWCTVGSLALAASSLQAAPKSASNMTGPWQLLIDDYLVASRSGLTRTYHPFQKYEGNPVIRPDMPWEFRSLKCVSVLPDESGQGFRMWYASDAPENDPDKNHALYATSVDGAHWVKPKLGLVAWKVDGSTANNLVGGGGSVMHTPDDPDPARRYKTGTSGGKYVFRSSKDGLLWQPLTKSEGIFKGGDVGRFHWDPFTNEFHAYVKVNAHVSGLRRRAVGYSEETSNFDTWPPLRLVMAPDDIDDRWVKPGSIERTHFYGVPTFAYETMYLGLLWVFRAEDDEGYFHGPIFTELVSSRDAVHWLREESDRPPIVECGPKGSWDGGMVGAAGMVVNGDKLMLYYSGYRDVHDILPMHSSIGLATLRKDGFASLDAGEQEGALTTKRLERAAGPLQVNYTGKGGELRVEVCDAEGKVLPGYEREACEPLRGDELRAPVRWREKNELPAGTQPIRLRFLLKNAALYAFNAGPDVRVIEDAAGPTLAALYTFEGDLRLRATDKLTDDGSQAFRFLGTSRVDREAANAAFGSQSLMVSTPWRPLNRVEIEGTRNLGTRFTLAVAARLTEQKLSRLFSAAGGLRPVNCSELALDCDPRGACGTGLRLICKGIPVQSPAPDFDDGKFHHLAVTYDDGHVRFYLDGRQTGEAWLPGGAPVSLARDLLFGEDAELGSDEQFNGYADDILVLGRVLSDDEIRTLSEKGAAVLFGVAEPPPLPAPAKTRPAPRG